MNTNVVSKKRASFAPVLNAWVLIVTDDVAVSVSIIRGNGRRVAEKRMMKQLAEWYGEVWRDDEGDFYTNGQDGEAQYLAVSLGRNTLEREVNYLYG